VRLTGVRQGDLLRIEFPGESGVRYQLEASDSLVGGTWQAVGDPVIGAGTTVSLTVPLDAQSRFYRVSARR
jgi:hypothetical protein